MSASRVTQAPKKVRSRAAGMNLWEAFRIAWRAILGNPSRSVLTTLGVVIGVAAVVALTMVGKGSTANVTRALQSLGTNLLTISSNTGRESENEGFGLVRSGGRRTITLADAEAVKSAFEGRLAGVAPVLQRDMQIKVGAKSLRATVIGTWPDYASVRNAQPAQGSFFTEADLQSRRRVAVIGYGIAQDLFGDQDPLGQRLRIEGVSFTVVGVLPDKGDSGFASPNYQVIVPLSTYLQRLERRRPGEPRVNAIYVQAPDKDSLVRLQQELTEFMALRRKITDPSKYDFSVRNQADALASVNEVTQTITLFLGGVAGISLLVGGIGIMNIMLVSVTERTREIGIRKALGAKPRDILIQFLVESVVLSVGGGVLGIFLGMAIAGSVGQLLGVTPILDPFSMVLAFAFSVAVGVFFGFYPAFRAARLDPVESLRYE